MDNKTIENQTPASRFTPEQQIVINSTGKTIVSASAGSGKTTVMIEKIIRLICGGESVSNILAVTFTKKAASQMKEKLRKALIKTINEPTTTPSRRATLKKQLDEVASADISTIHSFCAKLVRTHFYAVGIDNSFRVINGDDAEGTAMQSSALDELFSEGYENQDSAFLHLLSTYWRKKSDNALRGILLTAYKQLRNRADYKEYLQNCTAYDAQTFARVCADLHTLLQEKCAYYYSLVTELKSVFERGEYVENAKSSITLCNELCDCLQELMQSEDYFSACAKQKPKFTAKQRASKKDTPDFRVRVEQLAEIKKKVSKIYDDELSQTLSYNEELQRFLLSGETASAIAKYILLFDEKYSKLKTERGALDYNDLEHIALALLKNEEVLAQMRGKYKFVFVDEYQDVNPVQEELISRIGGDNIFLVGDVKQAIYGFRGSKSEYFVKTQQAFSQGNANSLKMTSNFRSSDKVLDAVNAQFSLAMTLQTSSVDYKNDSFMQKGGGYIQDDGRVQVHFLPEKEKAEKQKRGVYSVRERANENDTDESASATAIYKIIQDERASEWYDSDSKSYKRVKYSDIAILSRKKQGQISKTVASLSAKGVPVTASVAVNICEFSEIKTLIDWLSLIDNAEQDIPLCSALLSTTENLTFNDLTTIRLAYPNERFFRVACKKYAQEQSDTVAHKLRVFYEFYESMRKLAVVLNAGELLTSLISQTRMEARLLEMENGVACLKRMHRFIEETNNPEPLGLHAFLARLRDLSYKIEYSENGGEDAIKVLTMHSSKGLEYPVVIIDDLNAPFRGADHDEVLMEEKYGVAPRAFDSEKMLKRSTLLRRLCEHKQVEESVKDELNLYYVALTRAKFALHLVFSKKPIAPDVRYAHSFADFTDFSVWEKYFVFDDITQMQKQERTAMPFEPNKQLEDRVQSAFLWRYAHHGYEHLPVKSSATQLMDSYEENAYALQNSDDGDGGVADEEFEKIAENLTVTDTNAGLAYHAFLELFDFENLYQADGQRVGKDILLEKIQDTLTALAKTDETQAKLLDKDKIVEILSSEVFDSLRGKTLYKEQQFLVSLPIKDTFAHKKGVDSALLGQDNGEEMLFQGAIDLLAVGENGVCIIDYKYSKKSAQQLVSHYAPQLKLYRQATAKIMNIPQENIRCTIVNIYRGFQVEVD